MGMFDTFYGKYICQHCGKIVEFEEQTKDFDNCLLDFKLGDYVDRGDKNYFYNFTYECPECHAETELSIGIRNGQYAGVFLAEDARNMDPKKLANIENGLQRRFEYDKMCEEKIGLEEAGGFHDELIALKVGDTLEVLRTTWKILEAYYVKYPEGETSFLHHPTVIYRVEADGVNRVIKASINPFTLKLYYHVCEDNLEPHSPEDRYNDCDINRYRIEHDSILEKIPEGGSVWNAEEGLKEDKYIEEVANTEEHAELINGELVIEDKTTPEHNLVVNELVYTFMNYIKEHGGADQVYTENVGLYVNELLSDEEKKKLNFFLPDFMVVCDPESVDDNGIHKAPRFIAEVTSESTKVNDYNAKLDTYKKIGVQEYWIIDLQRKLIMKYTASDNYIPKTFDHPESMKVSMYEGLMVDVSAFML